MKLNYMIISLLVFSLIPASGFSENFASYLILQDIGSYKLEAPQKVIGGYIGGPRVFEGAGAIAPTGHFYLDHTDNTYEAYYEGGSALPSPTVQVTQHAGVDSDKWVLHEMEDAYRDGDMERLGLLTKGARLRDMSGNKLVSLRGSGYSWLSNNAVVEISYSDLEGNKPEPIEVIQAYLQKFPSTMPATLILDKAHDDQWTKDEMERRLWLCDKWFEQLAVGKADQKNALEYVIKSMNVFLDYREKYYRWSALEEKGLLAQYQQTGNEAKLREKLQDYKDWWSANKSTSLIGMITTCPQRLWSQARFYFKRLLVQLTSLPGQLLAMFG